MLLLIDETSEKQLISPGCRVCPGQTVGRESPALLTSAWLPGPAPARCLCMSVSACYAALNEDKQMCSSHSVQVWMMWSFSSCLAILSPERSGADVQSLKHRLPDNSGMPTGASSKPGPQGGSAHQFLSISLISKDLSCPAITIISFQIVLGSSSF